MSSFKICLSDGQGARAAKPLPPPAPPRNQLLPSLLPLLSSALGQFETLLGRRVAWRGVGGPVR